MNFLAFLLFIPTLAFSKSQLISKRDVTFELDLCRAKYERHFRHTPHGDPIESFRKSYPAPDLKKHLILQHPDDLVLKLQLNSIPDLNTHPHFECRSRDEYIVRARIYFMLWKHNIKTSNGCFEYFTEEAFDGVTWSFHPLRFSIQSVMAKVLADQCN